jgi:hypothetical protein
MLVAQLRIFLVHLFLLPYLFWCFKNIFEKIKFFFKLIFFGVIR